MATSTPTRERILNEAMRLFSEHGFRGTSVVQIEAAAGLTPGAGGIYHHFSSKEALLAAGIERHLGRLSALRDIRRLFTGLDDLRAELTLIARYTLAELDNESELLRILASEARSRPKLVEAAVNQLVDRTYAEFADWLRDSQSLPAERAQAVATVGLGALLSHRLLRNVLGVSAGAVDDHVFIDTWVEMVHHLVGPQ